jgi:hypothetical protein
MMNERKEQAAPKELKALLIILGSTNRSLLRSYVQSPKHGFCKKTSSRELNKCEKKSSYLWPQRGLLFVVKTPRFFYQAPGERPEFSARFKPKIIFILLLYVV